VAVLICEDLVLIVRASDLLDPAVDADRNVVESLLVISVHQNVVVEAWSHVSAFAVIRNTVLK
jgi:hypothetical protein